MQNPISRPFFRTTASPTDQLLRRCADNAVSGSAATSIAARGGTGFRAEALWHFDNGMKLDLFSRTKERMIS
jgi:hypothetical protein